MKAFSVLKGTVASITEMEEVLKHLDPTERRLQSEEVTKKALLTEFEKSAAQRKVPAGQRLHRLHQLLWWRRSSRVELQRVTERQQPAWSLSKSSSKDEEQQLPNNINQLMLQFYHFQ